MGAQEPGRGGGTKIRHRALGTKWSAPRLMQPREVEDCSFLGAQTPRFPGASGRSRALLGCSAWASGTVPSPTRAPKRAKTAPGGRPDRPRGPRVDERSLSDAQDSLQTPQEASKSTARRAPRGRIHNFSVGFKRIWAFSPFRLPDAPKHHKRPQRSPQDGLGGP